MSLTSASFYLFLTAACVLYYAVPKKLRRFVLLFINVAFYVLLGLRFTVTLVAVIAASYGFGLLLNKTKRKKLVLGLSVFVLAGVLITMKYLGFALSLFGVETSGTFLSLAVPIGLSFYALTCIGYLVDVYRGKTPAEKNFVDFSLFVGLFVQIMSGPIPRSYELLAQVKQSRDFDYERLKRGFIRIVFGLFTKLVVADNLAVSANHYFDNPVDANSYNLILAAVIYGIQIYCDFRAYSDIVLGAGEILGFTLMENFKAPYLSSNMREFWRRWHISLSNWFRDYLYFPLGGSRCHTLRVVFNTLVVFAVSGLWHGASLGFLAWGVLHGFYLSVSILLKKPREALSSTLCIKDGGFYKTYICPVFVFLLSDFAWIFFRAGSLDNALIYISNILRIKEYDLPTWFVPSLYFPKNHMWATLIGILLVFTADIFVKKERPLRLTISKAAPVVRFVFYYVLLFAVMFFGSFGNSSFIYINF